MHWQDDANPQTESFILVARIILGKTQQGSMELPKTGSQGPKTWRLHKVHDEAKERPCRTREPVEEGPMIYAGTTRKLQNWG